MEIKTGYSLNMAECITIYESLCTAGKEMGFKVWKD
jgi:hypothetical protein